MVGRTVLIAGHVCNIDIDRCQCYSGNSACCGLFFCNVEDPSPGLSFCMYLLGSLGNTDYVHYHIVYDFVAVHFSDSGNSETDVDYIEVFVLYFVVQIL